MKLKRISRLIKQWFVRRWYILFFKSKIVRYNFGQDYEPFQFNDIMSSADGYTNQTYLCIGKNYFKLIEDGNN